MPSDRPNILMITADEWRADALGCAGNPVVRTPNLDSLAVRGIRFTNAYTPAPMCVPARVSILTGQIPRVHGAMTNGLTPTDNVSIVQLLRDAGYRTAAFGKMHFVPVYHDLGFETMRLAEQQYGWQADEYHRWLWEEHRMVDWIDLWDQVGAFRRSAPSWFSKTYGALKSPLPEQVYHTTWITDRFIEYLDGTEGSKPFFAWVSYIKPHHPFDPPGRYAERYDPAEIPLPPPDDLTTKPLVRGYDPRRGHYDVSDWTDPDIRRMTALYYGTITHIDDSVGRIVAALQAKGLGENTVIVVNSDHGDYLGHHHFITKAPFVPYEDTIRIPFIIYDPRNRANGRTSEAFVNLLDLFPTFASLAGVSHDHAIHGYDLTPLLAGEQDQVTDVAVAENPWGVISIRQGPWKLLQSERNGACELYNLDEDSGERRNLYPAMAGSSVVHRLREAGLQYLLRATWDRYRRDLLGVQEAIDAEARQRGLPALPIDPGSWREAWSESSPEPKR